MSGKSTAIELQQRDIEMFRGLYECRVMTIDQIASLYFDNKREMARKRITKLKSADFLSYRSKDSLFTGTVVTLARSAHEVLEHGGHCEDLPHTSWQKLQKRIDVGATVLKHELQVVDVKVAFTTAMKSFDGYAIIECSTWPALHAFEGFAADGGLAMVYPDGFMRIERRESDAAYESTYYIEVDRSTERLDRIAARCGAYRDHYRSGGFALAQGGRREEYRDYYFRVLFTCISTERRDNIALRLLAMPQPIRSQVWITTHEELMRDPLGAIWIRPKDLELLPPDVDLGQPHRPLSERIVKHSLLNAPA